MKRLLALIIVAILFTNCQESSIVEPVMFDEASEQPQHIKVLTAEKQKQAPGTKEIRMDLSNSSEFNPNDRQRSSGAYLNKEAVVEWVDGNKKHTRNLALYTPSLTIIGEQKYKTYNIYTINMDVEIVSKTIDGKGLVDELVKQKTLGGSASGKFKIVLRDYSPESGLNTVLFSGRFFGAVNSHKADLKIIAQGEREFSAAQLKAKETMKFTGEELNFESSIEGLVSQTVYSEN